MRRNRGAVLIIVLGVLAVLALLATTFATLQATERKVSRNYLDTVRAKLLAQSGIDDALAQLERQFPGRSLSSEVSAQAWKYRGAAIDVSLAPGKDPLDFARFPSFSWKFEDYASQAPGNTNVKADPVVVEGKVLGFSGVMSDSSYARHGDQYALKVSDSSGRLHLNDGIEGGAKGSVTQNLKRMLNILGRQTKPRIPDLGDRILARRPDTGFQEIGQLQAYFTSQEFDGFHDFVTVRTWVDTGVANPVPLSARWVQQEKAAGNPMPDSYARARGQLFRLGKSKDAAGQVLQLELTTCPKVSPDDPSVRVYGLDTLNPQWIEITSRAPVNINSAAREVLITLLADLRGFFLSDRRRNNPNWSGGPYGAFAQAVRYSAETHEGSEYGYLMETLPIVFNDSSGTTTGGGGIDAGTIADEIIACRSKRASKNFNYGGVGWGGPFKSWRQFNAFADNLARPKADGGAGLLIDDRPIFVDYPETGGDNTGWGATVPSAIQKRHASQAIADVLKANFNPNLHLSILNPDENLYTIVDKTMLAVNSTEFTFVPAGYFEIESIGRVLRPTNGGPDALLAPDNEIVAHAKVRAVVKLYDLHRETSQKQFYDGTLNDRVGPIETSNNKSLELGPEPDNGLVAKENEWDGYIALPTVGGVYHDRGVAHQPGTMQRTMDLPAKSQFNDAFHIHFGLDFDAHYHKLGNDARQEIASRTLPGENTSNFPDALADGSDTPYSGPYGPASGPAAGASDYGKDGLEMPLGTRDHRLTKAFRLKTATSGTATYPPLTSYAPSDLRIDGAYSERHSAPAYFVSQGASRLWSWDTERARGMISFWFKPSFSPDRTGKIRKFWDFSRFHANCGQNCHVYPWTMIFFPAHYQPDMADVGVPFYRGEAIGRFRPASLVWGHTEWHHGYDTSWFGNISTCVNHLGHSDEIGKNTVTTMAERMDRLKQNPLQAHRWVNLTATWNLNGPEYRGEGSKFLINGSSSLVPFNWTTVRPGDPATTNDKIYIWDNHDGGDANHIRLGGTSKIGDQPGAPYRGNYSADGTIDEFYCWKTESDADIKTLWERGRYYNPGRSASAAASGKMDAAFLSKAIDLTQGMRTLAPPSGASTMAGSATAAELAQIRVLGLSWTWYGEMQDETGKPVMYDYNSTTGGPVRELQPAVQLGIVDGEEAAGLSYGPWDDDGYSAVEASNGSCPPLVDPMHLHWRARFRIQGTNVGTILLGTPVLDDVTMYFRAQGSPLVSYVFDNRSY
jgi:hypothetical protein